MTMFRFDKICENENHNLRRYSLIGTIHGYMHHLSVHLSCLKNTIYYMMEGRSSLQNTRCFFPFSFSHVGFWLIGIVLHITKHTIIFI